jgi:hypothetical protein
MAGTVDFHDQPSIDADEVQVISAHWMLAAEVKPLCAETAQGDPKPSLRRAHRFSHGAGFGDDRHIRRSHPVAALQRPPSPEGEGERKSLQLQI